MEGSRLTDMLYRDTGAKRERSTKVTVVGAGSVGTACAYSLMQQDVVGEIALVDILADKLRGEVHDFQHGVPFTRGVSIYGSTDYEVTKGSDLCVITAGARQEEGESRLSLVQRNVDIFKRIVPKLVEHSPETLILVVSNPVDVLTYVAWKLSGLPRHRVMGSGTNLDTARFRVMLAERLKVSSTSVHGWIIGEHGDTSVAQWSGVTVGGVSLKHLKPAFGTDDDPEDWKSIHKRVVAGAMDVIKLKGFTNWAIGLSVASLTRTIVRDQREIVAMSTPVKGLHGIQSDVYLSLPVVLGRDGISEVVVQQLDDDERSKLQKSAETIQAVQDSIQF